MELDIIAITKKASGLAKDNQLNEAIELLKSIIPEMAKLGGYGKSYVKIIPYFQKAGRYQEGVDYTENVLIPYIKQDCCKVFGHRCEEMQQAFQFINISKAYDKLRLCAKREKVPGDELKFEQLSLDAHERYANLLPKAELIELKKEYKKYQSLYGKDYSLWPGRLSRFDCLIKK